MSHGSMTPPPRMTGHLPSEAGEVNGWERATPMALILWITDPMSAIGVARSQPSSSAAARWLRVLGDRGSYLGIAREVAALGFAQPCFDVGQLPRFELIGIAGRLVDAVRLPRE
jgi:hypothetical protein